MVTAASALFRQLPVDQLRRLAFPLRPGCTQGQVKPWPQPCHQSIRTGRPDLSHALGALRACLRTGLAGGTYRDFPGQGTACR
jgi:hypothetical protein